MQHGKDGTYTNHGCRCGDCKDAKNKYQREYVRSIRFEAINRYGGKCKCCGESRFEFLSFDHINGGGTKHRREVNVGGNFHLWLKRNNWPDGFRLLCHNCNQSLGHYGYCPHDLG